MTDTQGRITQRFVAIGANRIPNASDWDIKSGLIAYGAGNAVALWRPDETPTCRSGVVATLKGHTDKVNAVRFLQKGNSSVLVSASVDKTLRVWKLSSSSTPDEEVPRYDLIAVGTEHGGSIVDVAIERQASRLDGVDGNTGTTIFASASADGTVKIWRLDISEGSVENALTCLQTITTKPKYLPLSVAIAQISPVNDVWILAVSGSSSAVQIYAGSGLSTLSANEESASFKLAATLTGHENWVRSLAFVRDNSTEDLVLASGSQDRYIRLWRIHQGAELPAKSAGSNLVIMGEALSNKAHRFEVSGEKYSVTFEALLIGHEDWVYNVSWKKIEGRICLLSSSADNSLSIWETDETSGIWVCTSRLGEASGMKGSSTATGSTGGFWTGLWAPNGKQVVSFGKSGGWRRWVDGGEGDWRQQDAVTGHVREVTGLAWEKGGRYLLSTSLDQSTRLYARWKSSKHRSWFEFSRPQIHGYDINSIISLTSTKFVSGAEEKLMRVFGEPRGIAKTLEEMCDIKQADVDALPDVASQPVLGLSNKAVNANAADGAKDDGDPEAEHAGPTTDLKSAYPPFEDSLSRHTLWPEEEKLYGHGYEISTIGCTNKGDILATACKASSTTHAVIRLFETKTWRQLKPALEAHSLTVNRIAFSEDDLYMLSVGRDRQWTVFERSSEVGEGLESPYQVKQVMPKAQTRVIFDGKWVPISVGRIFVTAARDKSVKVWTLEEDGKQWSCTEIVKFEEPITAIDILDRVVTTKEGQCVMMAVGLESGAWSVYRTILKEGGIGSWEKHLEVDAYDVPYKTITQISWRPIGDETMSTSLEVAISSEDSSVRIYDMNI
ncbi:hypothetical protein H072_4186 [Dactylellina haptotyla CBS 200.50]|uniref:Elongator complex protein 2 n=1 Tax=Dactylellina haptotyla (strain CBS 200.50) TaxID=1284197 RepID=S8AFR2_DACHA|nr:hypothetical protein H072_4186 [Dactylellina haptotyla CBS 200.50]